MQQKGRLWPSFFFLLSVASAVLAQQAVYRCGQEYTNAPVDASRCERLASQAVTVIPGTRVQVSGMSGGGQAPVPPAPARVEVAGQRQRDDMARAIVVAELDKARQRHAALLRAYQKVPEHVGNAATPTQPDDEQRVQLKAAVERSQRDIDSLQRELDRRPPVSAQP